MNSITIQIPEDTAERLDRLAERLSVPVDVVAVDALNDFIAREEWQLAEIESGLAEADRGDFASNEEVISVLARYGVAPKSSGT